MGNNQKFILSFLGIGAVTAIVIVGFVSLKAWQPDERLSVTGEGRKYLSPDIADLTMGVRTDNKKTAILATTENTAVMEKVIASLKSQGVESADIKTGSYNLFPQYNYTESKGQELTGWTLEQTVRVRVRDIVRVGEIVARATEAGANTVASISFTRENTDDIKRLAREEAIEKAKQKAQELAASTGIELGDVVTVYENEVQTPYPYYGGYGLGGGGEGAAPVQPGQNEYVIQVTVVYEVEE